MTVPERILALYLMMGYDRTIRFLIRDGAGPFINAFDEVFRSDGRTIIRTPPRTPVANAYVERWVETVRRELCDRTLIWNRGHLEQLLRDYVEHYNTHRPHRSLDQALANWAGRTVFFVALGLLTASLIPVALNGLARQVETLRAARTFALALHRRELGPIDLALQHQNLMAQGEDLGVSLVAGREQPSKAADNQVTEGRDEVHRRQKVSTARNSPKRIGNGSPAPTGLPLRGRAPSSGLTHRRPWKALDTQADKAYGPSGLARWLLHGV